MDFEREPWRKLYVRENLDHAAWPITWRGLRDYLVRRARDDGTLLAHTEDPSGDMARALGAHECEFELVKRGVDALLCDGYLTFIGGRLLITRFESGQDKSRSTDRVRAYRARKIAELKKSETLHGDVTKRKSETQTIRNETKRIDPPKPPRGSESVDEITSHYDGLWRQVVGRGRAPVWTAARKRKLIARMKEGYSVHDLCLATRALFASHHHVGGGFTGPEYFCRSAEQVDKMLGLAASGNGRKSAAEHIEVRRIENATTRREVAYRRSMAEAEASAANGPEKASAIAGVVAVLGGKR